MKKRYRHLMSLFLFSTMIFSACNKPKDAAKPSATATGFKPTMTYIGGGGMTVTGLFPDWQSSLGDLDMTVIAWIKDQAGKPTSEVQYCAKNVALKVDANEKTFSATIENCGNNDKNIYAYFVEFEPRGKSDDQSFAGSLIDPTQLKQGALVANVNLMGAILLDPDYMGLTSDQIDACFTDPKKVAASFQNLKKLTFNWTSGQTTVTNFDESTKLNSKDATAFSQSAGVQQAIQGAFCTPG